MDGHDLFVQLALLFFQDVDLLSGGFEESLRVFLDSLTLAEKNGLADYLLTLITSDLSERELIDMWLLAGADQGPYEGSAREFFKWLVEKIEASKSINQ